MSAPSFLQSAEASSFYNFFKASGARLFTSKQYFEDYLLDFCVNGLEKVQAHVNLGIHITSRFDDIGAMKTFLKGANRGIARKLLYIEVEQSIINNGAELVAYGAAINSLFERAREQDRALGIRIFEDCSLQYFFLEDNIARLRRIQSEHEFTIGQHFSGSITHYFTDRGFGFIQAKPEKKFFLHIANIIDDKLRAILAHYPTGHTIPVEFQYGGCDSGKYPKAINVELAGNEHT